MERLVSIDSLKIVPHDRRSLAAFGMTWGVTPQQRFDLLVIRAWLQEHPTNPFTRTPLLPENLIYDEPLRERIDLFVSNTLSQSSFNL